MKISEEELKEIGLTVGALAASLLLKKLLEEGYQSIFKEEPPNAVTDRDVNWGKVLAWTVVSGLTATATKVMIKRFGAQEIDT